MSNKKNQGGGFHSFVNSIITDKVKYNKGGNKSITDETRVISEEPIVHHNNDLALI
jgi:hypothetical protein